MTARKAGGREARCPTRRPARCGGAVPPKRGSSGAPARLRWLKPMSAARVEAGRPWPDVWNCHSRTKSWTGCCTPSCTCAQDSTATRVLCPCRSPCDSTERP
eukprot:scaffold141253_cov148-Phaeocystis_antarctica.AAC.1